MRLVHEAREEDPELSVNAAVHRIGTTWVKHGTRWNDTTTGAWTTTDPITHLNDPSNANPYQYAGNNPVNYVDPTGRIDWLKDIAAVFAITIGSALLFYTASVAPWLFLAVLGYEFDFVISARQLGWDLGGKCN